MVVRDASIEKLVGITKDLLKRNDIERVIQIFYTHGRTDRTEYQILIKEGWLSEKDLGQLVSHHPTETILLTCHSGACNSKHFSGPVAGPTDDMQAFTEFDLIDWMAYEQSHMKGPFPTTAKQFTERWKRVPGMERLQIWVRNCEEAFSAVGVSSPPAPKNP
jgi:hypothetical protein